jgi:hypothetical protein
MEQLPCAYVLPLAHTYVLPIEIWRDIALRDPQVYHSLAQVIRGLVRRKQDMRHFTKYYKEFDSYALPNGTHHIIDDETPSIIIGNVGWWFSSMYGIGIDDYSSIWFDNGEIHRDGDMPAIVGRDGKAMWCQHGKLHRDGDEPAVVGFDEGAMWYQHGKLHRDHGRPAVVGIRDADHCEYWVNGVQQI